MARRRAGPLIQANTVVPPSLLWNARHQNFSPTQLRLPRTYRSTPATHFPLELKSHQEFSCVVYLLRHVQDLQTFTLFTMQLRENLASTYTQKGGTESKRAPQNAIELRWKCVSI